MKKDTRASSSEPAADNRESSATTFTGTKATLSSHLAENEPSSHIEESGPSPFTPLADPRSRFGNRIVMAPMTRSRAVGSIPNDLMARYYGQRSTAGLIITEGTSPSPNGLGYARIPGIYSDEQSEGWKKITSKVHQKGGKIFLQLMHTGRISHPLNLPEGGRVVAPSAVRADSDMWTDEEGMLPLPVPEAMSAADIDGTVREYVTAAENAIKAGFDGVELHGANGYLIEQFINSGVNRRTDNYGGSVENRIRFAVEVTAAVAGVIGKEKTGIRLSPFSTFNEMPEFDSTVETYEALVSELDDLDILYLHIVEYSARSRDDGKQLLRFIRENFRNLVIANGGYTLETAEAALEEGRADLISFGTHYIANPDLPMRLKRGIPLSKPDRETFYAGGEKGYTDYSFS